MVGPTMSMCTTDVCKTTRWSSGPPPLEQCTCHWLSHWALLTVSVTILVTFKVVTLRGSGSVERYGACASRNIRTAIPRAPIILNGSQIDLSS